MSKMRSITTYPRQTNMKQTKLLHYPWERKPIEPFEQDCTKCRRIIYRILGDDKLKFEPDVYEDLKKRHSLSFKCFEYYPDGRPKDLRSFPSNLCHLLRISIEAVQSTWVGYLKNLKNRNGNINKIGLYLTLWREADQMAEENGMEKGSDSNLGG